MVRLIARGEKLRTVFRTVLIDRDVLDWHDVLELRRRETLKLPRRGAYYFLVIQFLISNFHRQIIVIICDRQDVVLGWSRSI